jgi:hypothetical protein
MHHADKRSRISCLNRAVRSQSTLQHQLRRQIKKKTPLYLIAPRCNHQIIFLITGFCPVKKILEKGKDIEESSRFVANPLFSSATTVKKETVSWKL